MPKDNKNAQTDNTKNSGESTSTQASPQPPSFDEITVDVICHLSDFLYQGEIISLSLVNSRLRNIFNSIKPIPKNFEDSENPIQILKYIDTLLIKHNVTKREFRLNNTEQTPEVTLSLTSPNQVRLLHDASFRQAITELTILLDLANKKIDRETGRKKAQVSTYWKSELENLKSNIQQLTEKNCNENSKIYQLIDSIQQRPNGKYFTVAGFLKNSPILITTACLATLAIAAGIALIIVGNQLETVETSIALTFFGILLLALGMSAYVTMGLYIAGVCSNGCCECHDTELKERHQEKPYINFPTAYLTDEDSTILKDIKTLHKVEIKEITKTHDINIKIIGDILKMLKILHEKLPANENDRLQDMHKFIKDIEEFLKNNFQLTPTSDVFMKNKQLIDFIKINDQKIEQAENFKNRYLIWNAINPNIAIETNKSTSSRRTPSCHSSSSASDSANDESSSERQPLLFALNHTS